MIVAAIAIVAVVKIALASAITGAIAGSAVPFVGNLIGFGVGMAIGISVYLLDTFVPQVRQNNKRYS